MVNDSGTGSSGKPQEIDLDEIEVNILILGKNAGPLNQAASFLSRRGWPATVLTNLSRAVEVIAETKPDFVLLSVNHPSQAILKLPELITQTFNVTCVGFAETGDAASQQKLGAFKVRNKVQGMPSGPNLHRTIRRILSESLGLTSEPNEKSANGPARQNRGGAESGPGDTRGTIRIAGSEPSAATGPGLIYQKGATPVGGSDPSVGTSESSHSAAASESVSTGKYTMSKRTRRSLKDLVGASGGASENGAGSAGSSELLGKLKRTLFGDSGTDAGLSEEQALAVHDVQGEEGSVASGAAITGVEGATPGPHSARSPVPEREETSDQLAALNPVQRFERAVVMALNKVCIRTPDTITRELGLLTKVAVFPVDSAQSPGYLVVGVDSGENKIEDFFLRTVENSIREELAALSVIADLESGFWIHVPEVPFIDWLNAAALFKVVVPHEDSEVATGFLSVAGSLPRATEHGEHKEMLAVAIDDIATDQPVNFKAYLHLKKNQKYFLYLRNGRQLQPEQKERLKGRNINNVFMKTVDAENLRMFMAASYLRESIKKAS